MKIVSACLRIIWECQSDGKRIKFWAMENPKARLRWFMGIPAMTFNPYEFGDAYRKPTDLWGNFNTEMKRKMVKLDPTQEIQSKMNRQQLLKIPKDYIRDPNMRLDAIARCIPIPALQRHFLRRTNDMKTIFQITKDHIDRRDHIKTDHPIDFVMMRATEVVKRASGRSTIPRLFSYRRIMRYNWSKNWRPWAFAERKDWCVEWRRA